MNAKQAKTLPQLYRRGPIAETEKQEQQVELRSLKTIWKEDQDKELDPRFVNGAKAR